MVNSPLCRLWLFAVGASSVYATTTGCRRLSTDVDWPTLQEWQEAIPGVEIQNNTDSLGPLPDYRIRAKCYEDVQTAVRFAAAKEVRVSVITTGHDQLGRNIAGSGLLIDVSLLQGARVSPSFKATAEGVENLRIKESVQTVTPIPGKQAAVTLNPAVNGFDLNTALDSSGLFLVGGTHGTFSSSTIILVYHY